MSDIIRRDPRAEWIARNRLHPLHAAMQTQQTRWMGPNGLIRKNPMRSPPASSAPTASSASTEAAPNRAPLAAVAALQRPRCSCRCIRSRSRRSISPWFRTWSVVAWAATTATCWAWPTAWPAATAPSWRSCSANTRKATFPQPASTGCWSSKAKRSKVMHRSSWCRVCALWITSSPRATGCCQTAAPVVASSAGAWPPRWANARRRGYGKSRTASASAEPGRASRTCSAVCRA